MADLHLLSAGELLTKYQDKSISPVDVIRDVFDAIDRHEPSVNAFVFTDKDGAMEAAKLSEARWADDAPIGMLDGVPVTVKDVVVAKGWPTFRGSNTTDDTPADFDAPSVSRLREEGAILIGKTTTPEFGWKGVTDCPKTGITRNPWNLDKTTGGSSGGAAAAAALGMGALHIGTDGGGSIRMPCGFTGIPGIKPTFARVPTYPLSLFGILSHAGPMARTVTDVALMLNVMTMPDVRDPYSKPYVLEDFTRNIEGGVGGLRIAYLETMNGQPVDEEVASVVSDAVNKFEKLGAVVDRINPDLPDSRDIFRMHWYAGASRTLRTLSEDQKKKVDPALVEIAEEGDAFTLAEYQNAMSERENYKVLIDEIFEKYDLIITPTLPITAFDAGIEFPETGPENDEYKRWTDWTQFTYPFNLTGHPAGSVPCGLSSDNMPISMQIVGPEMSDGRVLRAMRSFEVTYFGPLPAMAYE
ncbi:amidase [Pseudemcibacter aquimaris]|uniref:amidase n=1 Tax=Pseudemcibacter aquimaris TaxID=2857064 RepID=UPI002011E0A5|nr:amidase [Pseudemcibacter aquimaris]MCC3860252.1 amidase [Pseudemcibacter aquimaris]WDU57577.1 amidase [Pseudemcibacter aquimaris]